MYYNAKIAGVGLSQLEVVVLYFNDSLSGSGYSSETHFLTSEYQMDMKTEGWQRWEAVLPSHRQLRSVDQYKSDIIASTTGYLKKSNTTSDENKRDFFLIISNFTSSFF